MESSQVWHPTETHSTISDISSCAAWHRFKTAEAYHQPVCEGAQQQAKQHHPPAYQDLAQAVSPHCQRSVPYTFQAKANTQIHQGLTTICKQLKATMWNQHVTHAQADARAGSCNNPPFSLCLAPSMFPRLHWELVIPVFLDPVWQTNPEKIPVFLWSKPTKMTPVWHIPVFLRSDKSTMHNKLPVWHISARPKRQSPHKFPCIPSDSVSPVWHGLTKGVQKQSGRPGISSLSSLSIYTLSITIFFCCATSSFDSFADFLLRQEPR